MEELKKRLSCEYWSGKRWIAYDTRRVADGKADYDFLLTIWGRPPGARRYLEDMRSPKIAFVHFAPDFVPFP